MDNTVMTLGLKERVLLERATSEPPPVHARSLGNFLSRNGFLVLVLGVSCAVLTAVMRSRIGDDSWYTLLGGRLIAIGGLPVRDTLTAMTAGHRWVDQQWLAQLGFYEIWRAGGWPLALLTVVALYCGSFVVSASVARRLGASDRNVAWIALVCFVVGSGNTVLRAQMIGYLLFAGVLGLLLLDEIRPSRRVLLVFPLLALWANIHGSVLVGAGLVSLRGATILVSLMVRRSGQARRGPRGAMLLLAPWLFVFASPYALHLPGYYRGFLNNQTLESLITEWSPTNVHNQPFFFLLLFGGLWLVFRTGSRVTPYGRLVFLVMTVGGLLAVRDVVWCTFTGAAVLPAALDSVWVPAVAVRKRRLDSALATTGVTAAVLSALLMASHDRAWFEHSYPRSAEVVVARAAASNPKLEIYASDSYADWLLFEDPDLAGRVANDIRFELLSNSQMAAIVAFQYAAGPNWQRIVAPYGLLVLNQQADQAPIDILKRQRSTSVLYRDRSIVVIRRLV